MTTDLEPTPAEKKLIDAAARGEAYDYRVGEKEADDPAKGEKWGDERTLRAEIIYALCVGTRPEWTVHAKGVLAMGARIVGDLDFEAATLRVRLGLIYCRIDEPISLVDARTRTLNFGGSHCRSISADRLVVEGGVFLRDGFVAKGEVRLLGANIGGNLDCSGARFVNPGGVALGADGLVAKGGVFLRGGFTAKGEVRLLGADIGGDLDCSGARFVNPDGVALSAENMRVGGALFWRELAAQPNGIVNFGHAKVEQLLDDKGSWPAPGNLILDGFVYGSIAGDAPRTASERLEWLRLQPKVPVRRQPYEQLVRVLRQLSRWFRQQPRGPVEPRGPVVRRQPYEQLVRVLRQMGREEDARAIAIAKQEAIRKSDETGWLRSLWMGFLGITIGYGYKPWRALLFMAFFLVLGAAVFSVAHDRQIMVPSEVQASDPTPYISCTESYPCLQPIMYSVDAFLPIIDLHQEKYWLPDVRKDYGWLYRAYLWLHISFGWILTTVLVVGLTGLVKKD